jgi:trehalose 6-phosphate synthase
VVTALGGLLAHHDVTWVASAMSEEDRAVAAEHEGSFDEETRDGAAYRLRLVAHDPAAYDRYYNVLANPTLWFLQHYLWGLGSAPDFDPRLHEAWDAGYVPVNEAFATATLGEIEREPDAAVMFHDYHLYIRAATRAGGATRARDLSLRPHPLAGARLLARLARGAARRSARRAAGQRRGRLPHRALARAFLLSAQRLLGARVDEAAGTVEHRGRRTRVVAHPIGVDAAEFDRLGEDSAVLERESELAERRPEQLVLRVDRIDPSKNVVRGFHVFALLLERHPELHGKVAMVALLAPSREDIPEYAEYAVAVERAAREVNERFGRDGWQPVDLDIADDFSRSVAGYKQFDVLFVNPVFDGLNLVAKEAFLVNGRDGVLVLSENAGVHEELGEWALSVNPLDVSGQADALHAALVLEPAERRRRAAAIRGHVRAHGIQEWLGAQLADLDAVRSS